MVGFIIDNLSRNSFSPPGGRENRANNQLIVGVKMPNTKCLAVPYDIYQDFLDFLDASQAQYTDDDLEDMDPIQKQVIEFIRNTLGSRATQHFHSVKDQLALHKINAL